VVQFCNKINLEKYSIDFKYENKAVIGGGKDIFLNDKIKTWKDI